MIKPLPVRTPFFQGESITSWLVRSALNQGCDTLTFSSYYWSDFRMWVYDVDKGFNRINEAIHDDFAVLAQTERGVFDENNLLSQLSNFADVSSADNINNKWTLPLSKRNRRSRIGYNFCPLCLAEDEVPYLRLKWRFSWYVYCERHTIAMETDCFNCGTPYQPNMIPAELRHINYCPNCQKQLNESYLKNLLVEPNAFKLQEQALTVIAENKGVIFDKEVTVKEWFDFMLFLMGIARRAAKTTNPNYMFYKFMCEMGVDVGLADLEDSLTGLAFDYLHQVERIRFMKYAYILLEKTQEEWLQVCEKLNISQNSFHFSKRQTIPCAFFPVYNQLPINNRTKRKNNTSDIKPTSPQAVKKSWERLQRKMKMKDLYEQQLIRTSDK